MSISTSSRDQVDLVELFASLRAYTKSIAVICVFTTLLAAFYAYQIAQPSYEAKVVFALEGKAGPSLPGLGGLAALAGINLPNSGSENLHITDLLESSDFILAIAQRAGLYDDPSFNPKLALPSKHRSITDFLGFPGEKKKWSRQSIDNAIVGRFRRTVTLGETQDKAQVLKVVNPNPARAAVIANTVVKSILAETLKDQIAKNQKTTDYLRSELLRAQEQLDQTSSAVQAFVIAHNAQSLQELSQQSAQLVQLRQTRSDTFRALQGVQALAVAGTLEEKQKILKEHPELTSPDMLMMGASPLNQNIAKNTSAKQLAALSETLKAHLESIDASIATTTKHAKLSAKDAAELLQLQRDVKVNEGTYKALVEQYNSHSISSGFQAALGKIYQYASPPLSPAGPRHSLIIALGVFFGLLLGAFSALLRSVRLDTIYSLEAIQSELPDTGTYRLSRTLRRLLENESTNWNNYSERKHEFAPLAAICAENKTHFITISGLGARFEVYKNLALGISGLFATAELRTAIVELSQEDGDHSVQHLSAVVDVITVKGLDRSFAVGDLSERIREVTNSYDRIIVLVQPDIITLRSLLTNIYKLNSAFILFFKTGKGTRTDLRETKSVMRPAALVRL